MAALCIYPETDEFSRENFYLCGLFDRNIENLHAFLIQRTIESPKENPWRVAPFLPFTGLA
jgi:hypothetical protein